MQIVHVVGSRPNFIKCKQELQNIPFVKKLINSIKPKRSIHEKPIDFVTIIRLEQI